MSRGPVFNSDRTRIRGVVTTVRSFHTTEKYEGVFSVGLRRSRNHQHPETRTLRPQERFELVPQNMPQNGGLFSYDAALTSATPQIVVDHVVENPLQLPGVRLPLGKGKETVLFRTFPDTIDSIFTRTIQLRGPGSTIS